MYNQKRLQRFLKNGPEVEEKKAKNIIIFIGDGMGVQTVTAGRIYKGQVTKGVSGEEEELVWENFPYTGLSKVSLIFISVESNFNITKNNQTLSLL